MLGFEAIFVRHAYALLFVWVLLEQAGVPIPSLPVMVAAGTMSAAHRLHIAYVLPLIVGASLIADSAWYMLGRRYGRKILDWLCKFSLESSTCVVKTQGTMGKRGAVTLLFAKFVPGLSTMAPPIAGQARLGFGTFLVYDTAGTVIWASVWLFAGRFFGDVAKQSTEFFGMLARFAVVLVLSAVVGVVGYRLWKLRQFRSELVALRLEPAELFKMIADALREGRDAPFVVDLRHPLDVLSDAMVLPGALRIGPDELKQRRELIPHDRDVVLYCTCPSEETSAKVAMELKKMGVQRVRPLRGGLQAWKDAGFAVEVVELV